MDGAQRNFSMMAEKIDRMRCLRERCDNYIRLIKLTLDETIQKQNSLLDGTAIHNRLKYLGIMDTPSSSNTFNVDNIYPENTDFEKKYKYLVIDDRLGIRRHIKPDLNANEMYLSNNYNCYYNSNYKPRIRDIPFNRYDDTSQYTPINSKKYGEIINFRSSSPQEHQIYYFPSSKPIIQYPRQTTERFYKRKPIKQYPKEEVPNWRTQYQKPVRVVERESYYPTTDYNFRISKKITENTPKCRARYCSMNDNSIMYRDYDESSYYCKTDLSNQPFSSITRPRSPMYSRDTWYDKTHSENPKSLLEKKIRDYVWNPHKKRVEKYLFPNYETNTYYSDFKPLRNKRQGNEILHTRMPLLEFDSQVGNKKNEASYEILSERKYSEDQSSLWQNDDNFSDDPLCKNNDYKNIPSYKKNSENPVHYAKRISFDLYNENIEIPNRKNPIGENSNVNSTTKQRRLNLEKTELCTKLDDQHRIPLLSNDDYSISSNKRTLPSTDKNIKYKLESTSKLEPDDNRLNFKNNFPENCSNSLEKNSFSVSDVKKVDYDHVNENTRLYQEIPDEKNKNVLKPKDISNENAGYCELIRRNSNDSRRKLTDTIEKSKFIQRAENVQSSDKRDYDSNVMKRRESYKDEWKTKKENIPGSRKNSNNVSGDKLIDNYHQGGGLNESQSSTVDLETNEYVMAGREADRIEQPITTENENVSAEIMDVTLPLCDNFDSEMHVPNRRGKQPEDISNDGNQNYYHSRGRLEDVERFTAADENYYPDKPLAVNGENEENIVATADEYYNYQNPKTNVTRENNVDNYYHQEDYSNDDVVTTTLVIDSAAALREEFHPEDELAVGGENNIRSVTAAPLDDYNNYYQNPATDGTRENDVDDYYHRDGYSNDNVVATLATTDSATFHKEYHPEDELAVGGENNIRSVTAAPLDDYNNYYQNPAADGTRENVDENYYSSGERPSMAAKDDGYYYENAGEERREGNDDGQYAENADYYYQNYSEMDRTAIGRGAEYAGDELVEHDNYYSEGQEGGNGDDTRRGNGYYYGGSESVDNGGPEDAKSTERQITDDGDYYYEQLGENYDDGVTNNSYYPNSHPDDDGGGGGDYDVKSYDNPTDGSDYNYSENIVTMVDENQSSNL